MEEIEKHSNELAKRMRKTRNEFETALSLMLSNIEIVPSEEYAHLRHRALSLCPENHENNWMFFALAISLDCALWSNNKDLKNQSKIKVYSTEELVEKLG